MNRTNNFVPLALGLAAVAAIVTAPCACAQETEAQQPRVVRPGDAHRPPADAVVLLGPNVGADTWTHANGRPVEWIHHATTGTFTIKPGTGSIISKQEFGDAQIHLEFATPEAKAGAGQNRGNSGVYIQSRYEVQILDSYKNETYPNGQCAAIYGQYPPLVNVCRPPGAWQTYDIIFHAATFSDAGERETPATMTVFHNGVLVQSHAILNGGSTTASQRREGPGDGPLYLQDHGHQVRYRNIWVRPLKPRQ